MTLDELQSYEFWIGKSALTVYTAVRDIGGWKKVFPDHEKFPVWASKIRNYFNVYPVTLKRLSDKEARPYVNNPLNLGFLVSCRNERPAVQSANRKWQNYKPNPSGKYDPPPFKLHGACPASDSDDIKNIGWKDSIALTSALTGDVYKDEYNQTWFQMAAGSTIYHWGNHPSNPTAEAVYWDKIMGQNDTPVFKLVSPDGTGGSREVIIHNAEISDGPYNNRSTVIWPKVNEAVDVRQAIETDSILQGSYNYSETTRVGLAAHDKRDVKAHVHDARFYVNPQNLSTQLSTRKFPELDNLRKPLADQE